jgi:hypothetical protein
MFEIDKFSAISHVVVVLVTIVSDTTCWNT